MVNKIKTISAVKYYNIVNIGLNYRLPKTKITLQSSECVFSVRYSHAAKSTGLYKLSVLLLL